MNCKRSESSSVGPEVAFRANKTVGGDHSTTREGVATVVISSRLDGSVSIIGKSEPRYSIVMPPKLRCSVMDEECFLLAG